MYFIHSFVLSSPMRTESRGYGFFSDLTIAVSTAPDSIDPVMETQWMFVEWKNEFSEVTSGFFVQNSVHIQKQKKQENCSEILMFILKDIWIYKFCVALTLLELRVFLYFIQYYCHHTIDTSGQDFVIFSQCKSLWETGKSLYCFVRKL